MNGTGPGQEETPDFIGMLCAALCSGLNNPSSGGGGGGDPSHGPGNQDTTQRLIQKPPAPQANFEDHQGFSKDCCRSMIAMLDADKSGKLGYTEFESLMNDIHKWKEVFKMYDRNGVGRLSAYELRDALNSAGYQLNNKILNALVHRYGSRDGTIAFDDFVMCAVRIRTMIDTFNAKDAGGEKQATFDLDNWIETTVYS